MCICISYYVSISLSTSVAYWFCFSRESWLITPPYKNIHTFWPNTLKGCIFKHTKTCFLISQLKQLLTQPHHCNTSPCFVIVLIALNFYLKAPTPHIPASTLEYKVSGDKDFVYCINFSIANAYPQCLIQDNKYLVNKWPNAALAYRSVISSLRATVKQEGMGR